MMISATACAGTVELSVLQRHRFQSDNRMTISAPRLRHRTRLPAHLKRVHACCSIKGLQNERSPGTRHPLCGRGVRPGPIKLSREQDSCRFHLAPEMVRKPRDRRRMRGVHDQHSATDFSRTAAQMDCSARVVRCRPLGHSSVRAQLKSHLRSSTSAAIPLGPCLGGLSTGLVPPSLASTAVEGRRGRRHDRDAGRAAGWHCKIRRAPRVRAG